MCLRGGVLAAAMRCPNLAVKVGLKGLPSVGDRPP